MIVAIVRGGMIFDFDHLAYKLHFYFFSSRCGIKGECPNATPVFSNGLQLGLEMNSRPSAHGGQLGRTTGISAVRFI